MMLMGIFSISIQWFEYLELKKNPDCMTIPPLFEVEIAVKRDW